MVPLISNVKNGARVFDNQKDKIRDIALTFITDLYSRLRTPLLEKTEVAGIAV